MKQLSKSLQLDDEQQAKVKALYDEETKDVDKLEANTNLSVTQRLDQTADRKKQTYEKIKPLLSATQAEKLEQLFKKSTRQRK